MVTVSFDPQGERFRQAVNFLVLAYLFVTFAANVKMKLTATITISRQHQFASFQEDQVTSKQLLSQCNILKYP